VTMAIVNPASFLEKVGPLLEERVGRRRPCTVVSGGVGRLKMAIEGREIELSPESFTLLFFGIPEKLRSEDPRSVQARAIEGLSRALPLPTPTFGLNYI